MREIKFRAWHKKLGEMVDVGAVFSNGYVACKPITKVSVNSQTYNKDEVELMQYTGIKDKNGKEIYEGDLINIYATDFSHKFPESINDICKAHSLVGNSETHWEIIGNIYENPNLLK